MSDDLPARFLSHVRERGLLPRPGLALLAVSGGPDSVALLELMAEVRSDLGVALALAHVDHGISADSGDVAEVVLARAARHEIPGYLTALRLGPGTSETLARRARYRALRATQRRIGADYLLTAHHADDQAETVLYRALRGSAPAGLAGIAPVGPNGLVRPLLPFRRHELDAWLASRLPVHLDPANADDRHDRSWLRHRVLPVLRERFGPALDDRLVRLARYAADDVAAWAAVLQALPGLDFRAERGVASVASAPLRAYDKVLSVALLRAAARSVGAPMGPVRAARLARFAAGGRSGQRLELGQGWIAEIAFERVRLVRPPPPADGQASWGEGDAGRTLWSDWEILWRREPAGDSTRRGETAWVAVAPGEVRSPRRGDVILPLGGSGHRPVRRLLMEARVPRADRPRFPVLVQGGRVVWLPGVCRSGEDIPPRGSVALRVDVRAR